MEIRDATPTDLDRVLAIHRAAFGTEDEAELTRILLDDPQAHPMISLVASDAEAMVGHILLTRARVEGHNVNALMLGPLGVDPDRQHQGIGSRLTMASLRIAAERETELVFLAGHPDFYPRFGFRTHAGDIGFAPPVPMPTEHAAAWMVNELVPGSIERCDGHVTTADELMNPKYWTE